MPAHHPKQDPHGHPGHRFPPGPMHRLYGLEKSVPLSDVARILSRFAGSLESSGKVRLGKDLEVAPPDPCETLIHYEQTPKGHLVLKIELKWGVGSPGTNNGSVSELLDESLEVPVDVGPIPFEERL